MVSVGDLKNSDRLKMTNQIELNGDVYHIHEELGKGTFAYVVRGVNSKSKKSYALKVVLSGVKTSETESLALTECGFHPNIIQFYMTCTITDKTSIAYIGSNELPVLLFEQATNGDLFQIISRSKAGLPEIVCRTYFFQLFEALKHLHARGIYHRDIKVENLLLDQNFNLKLADFGLAYLSKQHDTETMKEKESFFSSFPFSLIGDKKKEVWSVGDVGTTPYAAPEIFTDKYYLGSAVDIWSSGCALFVMLLGCPPFIKPVRNQCHLFNYIVDGHYSTFWSIQDEKNILSSEVKNLLENIFQPDPRNRITVSKVFEHEWMKSKILSALELKCVMMNINAVSKRKRSRETHNL
jgi:serine/threonine protein kinase